MWVLTEGGELVNLEQVTHIEANAVGVWATVTTEHEAVDSGRCLCKCTDEEHGRQIALQLASNIARGTRLVALVGPSRPNAMVPERAVVINTSR